VGRKKEERGGEEGALGKGFLGCADGWGVRIKKDENRRRKGVSLSLEEKDSVTRGQQRRKKKTNVSK